MTNLLKLKIVLYLQYPSNLVKYIIIIINRNKLVNIKFNCMKYSGSRKKYNIGQFLLYVIPMCHCCVDIKSTQCHTVA
ncbi:hypothetical protein [Rickettsia endosymbiont of Cantharis rufa]|uniref:hypothetical protein n=1 Tax=Rickettsia endosymbiont of Cantharis rufa TaxID=3066248 RepID=UPI003132CE8D